MAGPDLASPVRRRAAAGERRRAAAAVNVVEDVHGLDLESEDSSARHSSVSTEQTIVFYTDLQELADLSTLYTYKDSSLY